MDHHLISWMLVSPFIGAVLQAFVPDQPQRPMARWVALGTSLFSGLCGAALVLTMQTQTPELQATEVLPWIGSYAIHYDMGIDGLNAPLVLLISILFPILIAAEWTRQTGVRGMHGLFLILQSACIGSVFAQDIFLQFFFFSLSALPFYFLIGVWGEKGRESAAFRSVVASAIGNALLFAALLLIYYSIDPHSFSLHELAGGKLSGKTFEFLGHEFSVSVVAFSLICAGLALRAPVWPLHGWFTHVAQEAPFSVVVAMSAVTVPIATYIMERLTFTLFPETLLRFAPVIVIVGAISLVMGAVCAVAQNDLRKLLAFICLGQVGLVLLGVGSLHSAGSVGAVYLQLVLGLGLAGFGLFANLLAERTGQSLFREESGERTIGGIAMQAPAMAAVAAIAIASLLGFPGFGGFVGTSLVMVGSFSVHPAVVLVAGASILLGAYCLFTMYRFVFLGGGEGSTGSKASRFADLGVREQLYLIPLVAALLFFGLYPRLLIELVRPTVLTLLSTVK